MSVGSEVRHGSQDSLVRNEIRQGYVGDGGERYIVTSSVMQFTNQKRYFKLRDVATVQMSAAIMMIIFTSLDLSLSCPEFNYLASGIWCGISLALISLLGFLIASSTMCLIFVFAFFSILGAILSAIPIAQSTLALVYFYENENATKKECYEKLPYNSTFHTDEWGPWVATVSLNPYIIASGAIGFLASVFGLIFICRNACHKRIQEIVTPELIGHQLKHRLRNLANGQLILGLMLIALGVCDYLYGCRDLNKAMPGAWAGGLLALVGLLGLFAGCCLYGVAAFCMVLIYLVFSIFNIIALAISTAMGYWSVTELFGNSANLKCDAERGVDGFYSGLIALGVASFVLSCVGFGHACISTCCTNLRPNTSTMAVLTNADINSAPTFMATSSNGQTFPVVLLKTENKTQIERF